MTTSYVSPPKDGWYWRKLEGQPEPVLVRIYNGLLTEWTNFGPFTSKNFEGLFNGPIEFPKDNWFQI